MAEEQKNPDFEKIVPLCIHELDLKFHDYRNSWMTSYTPYWLKRISNELEEYQKSMTDQSAKRKLLNIINMCAMAWDNLENGRMTHAQI